MVQRKLDDFSAYSMAKRYWFIEAMIKTHEGSICRHCGTLVHSITENIAVGPMYEPDMVSGLVAIKYLCLKCHGSGDYTMSWKEKRVLLKVLEIYKKDKINDLLVFNIWERIYYRIRKFLNLKVPRYVV